MKINFKRILAIILLFFNISFNVTAQEEVNLTNFQKNKVDEYLELSEMYDKEGNIQQSIFYLNKVAFIYWDAGEIENAIHYFLESVPLNEKINNYTDIKAIYSNIGLMYTDQEKLEEALEYFNKSLTIRRKVGDKAEIASGLIDVAYILGLLRNYDKAIDKVEEALEVSQRINNPQLTLNCFNLLADYFKNTGNLGKANEYLDKYASYSMHQETEGLKEVYSEQISKTLAEVEKEKAEKRANQLQFEVNKLKMKARQDSVELISSQTSDSLKDAEQLSRIRQIEIDRLEVNREKDALALKQEQAIRQKQKVMLISAGIVLTLVGLMSLLLYRSGQARLRVNKKLEVQNKEIQEQKDKITKQKDDISKSINYAQGIQKALLPRQEELSDYLSDSFIFFKPRDVVSGDYYWFNNIMPFNGNSDTNEGLKVNSDKFAISAIDCTGHGVPGAFMSMIGYNLLDEIIASGEIQANIMLEKLHVGVRKALRQGETDNHDGMDMALCVIDRQEKTIEFAGAKNPMIYMQDGKMHRVKGDKNPIGGIQTEPVRKFTSHTIKVDRPTWVYLFSDGFADQFGGKDGRKFMSKRFYDLLLEIHKDPMPDQRQLIKETLINWKGDYKQIDDVLVVGFRIE